MSQVMLDLETMSTEPNAAIVSIGAVFFDLAGHDTLEGLREEVPTPVQGVYRGNRHFYAKVRLKGQQEWQHRHISESTVEWWLSQSNEARAELLGPNRTDLYDALSEFKNWCDAKNADALWGYGANFDNVIVESAWRQFEEVRRPDLFPFRKHRCARTVMELACVRPERHASSHHNAVEDARAQVVALQRAYRLLKGERP